MNCKNCGSNLESGAKFCGNCGSQVEMAESLEQSSMEAISSSNISNDSQTFSDDEKKGSKKKFLLPIIILLVIAGVCCFAFFYLKSPKRIITSVINNAYDKFDGLLASSNSFDYENNTILMNGSLSIDTDIPDLMDLNSENLSYSFGMDYSNKKMEMGLSLSEDNNKLIDMVVYLLNNQGYISLKDDFPSLIKIDDEDTDFSDVFSIEKSNITDSDLKYIIKTYKDILIDSLDSSDFSRSSEKIKLDGKDVKVNKLTYEFNTDNYRKLCNRIIDKTLADDTLLETLARISSVNVADLKSELERSKDSISDYSFNESLSIDIYTKGVTNKFVGLDIKGPNGVSICFRVNSDNTTVELYVLQKVATIVINKVNDNSYSIDFNTMFNVNGNISIVENKISDNKVDGSIRFSLDLGDNNFVIMNKFSTEIGAKISDIDTTNSKNANDLTEEEINNLSSLYTSRFEKSKIYNLFSNLSSIMEDSYYGDLDYDDSYYDDFDFDSSL